MDEHRLLSALADPTRRTIFETLTASGPLPVGLIARGLPVTRPAVSQHLKVLADAGLVTATSDGTRRIYAVNPAALTALRAWIEAQWESVLDHFADAAEQRRQAMSVQPAIAPVVKNRIVPLEPAQAFELFTAGMGDWWPLSTHSIGREAAIGVRFERKVGGSVVELTEHGEELSWADVLAWDPPHRFVLSWHPDRNPLAASTLEVRFRRVSGGTEVVLQHGGWEAFGPSGNGLRANYDGGWDMVLERFENAAGSARGPVSGR